MLARKRQNHKGCEERIFSVYALKEPESDIVRYIGYTGKSIEYRLRRHLDGGKTRKDNWIKSLKNKGLRPSIELLDDNLLYEEAIQKEIDYIKLFLSAGARLTNLTIGGDGMRLGYMSDEVRKKIGNAHRGKKYNEETLKKMSEGQKGRIAWNKGTKGVCKAWNKGIKSNAPSPRKGKQFSKEVREKMSKARMGKIPWNKGKGGYKIKPRTEDRQKEIVANISKGAKNRKGEMINGTFVKKI